MGRTIGLGRIWSIVLGFRSLVARLAPFKRESEQRGRIFWQRKVWTSAPQWWDRKCEGRNEKCDFLARESVNSQQLCEFLAWESVNSSPVLARQWWRHFRLSLFLSLSLYLSLSLSPSVPHAQYRKRFRASYNRERERKESVEIERGREKKYSGFGDVDSMHRKAKHGNSQKPICEAEGRELKKKVGAEMVRNGWSGQWLNQTIVFMHFLIWDTEKKKSECHHEDH